MVTIKKYADEQNTGGTEPALDVVDRFGTASNRAASFSKMNPKDDVTFCFPGTPNLKPIKSLSIAFN